jgi:hypothetical protein
MMQGLGEIDKLADGLAQQARRLQLATGTLPVLIDKQVVPLAMPRREIRKLMRTS